MDRNPAEAYKYVMEYPTVRVRIDGPEIKAEVDIAPKPEPENLVIVSEEEHAPSEPPAGGGLPNWMLYSG